VTLSQWAENGWLKPHGTSRQEVQGQLAAAARDLADAGKDLSPDWQFAIAYNAALRIATVVLYASGYAAVREQKHYRTIAALPLALGPEVQELATFLDRCRVKRSAVAYESLRAISPGEVEELIAAAKELKGKALEWLRAHHTELLS
jgi:hypothetical protein